MSLSRPERPKTPVPLPPAPAGDVPALLRHHLQALRLSKRAMVARLGVEEATNVAWERREYLPDLRTLPGLLAVLGAPLPPLSDPSLGDRLRARRRAAGCSRAEAAAMAGFDPRTLGTVGRGGHVSAATRRTVEALIRTLVPVQRA